MKECPKCGGKCGFTYTARYTATRVSTWDRTNDEENSIETFKAASKVRCEECGKTVPMPELDET